MRLFSWAMEKADVADEGVVIAISALRHSNIVRQLLANVLVRVVATLHDMSVESKRWSVTLGAMRLIGSVICVLSAKA